MFIWLMISCQEKKWQIILSKKKLSKNWNFKRTFSPWRLQTRKETASVSTIKKFHWNAFLFFIRLDNSSSTCRIHSTIGANFRRSKLLSVFFLKRPFKALFRLSISWKNLLATTTMRRSRLFWSLYRLLIACLYLWLLNFSRDRNSKMVYRIHLHLSKDNFFNSIYLTFILWMSFLVVKTC